MLAVVPRIRSVTGQDAASAILEASLELFQERGISGASLADVAQRIGVTKAALYHHFQTKDALVTAAIAPLATDLEAFCDAGSAATRTDELVELAVRRREIVLLGDPRLSEGLGKDLKHRATTIAARLVRALAGTSDEQARTRALIVIASICGVVGDPACTEETVEELKRVVRMVVSGGGSAHELR